MKTALTIAGSDSSGGAGIQADIKTMMANGVYAMSAITALTAQNTTGVAAIQNATAEFLGQELDSVFNDIFPFCFFCLYILIQVQIMKTNSNSSAIFSICISIFLFSLILI